jgi:hypothetical protein
MTEYFEPTKLENSSSNFATLAPIVKLPEDTTSFIASISSFPQVELASE